MTVLYDSKGYNVNCFPNTFVKRLLLPRNGNRISLIISSGDTGVGATIQIYVSNSSYIILESDTPYTLQLLYRDFGPLVQEDYTVLVSNPSNPSIVYGTEVFRVPCP